MSAESEKPKIFVDEDWKSQVQAEKEAAKSDAPSTSPPSSTSTGPAAPGSTEGSSATSGSSPHTENEAAGSPEPEMPPASLFFLCTTIATQAMIALGQVPNPLTGKTDLRLKQAKHYIDTLAMLEEKTAGNRTPDESTLFDDLLHQLRMAYVMQNV